MLICNEIRADEVLGELLDLRKARDWPYRRLEDQIPQSTRNLPININDRDKDLLLFCSNLFMARMESDTAFRGLRHIYETWPAFFDPDNLGNYSQADLAYALRKGGLMQPELKSAWWRDNLARIRDNWGGLPRNVFKGVETFEEACLRVRHNDRKTSKGVIKQGFYGFQEKMISMWIYFLKDAGFLAPGQLEYYPIPIDIHVIRFTFATEIFVETEPGTNVYTKKHLAAMRRFLEDLCRKRHWNPEELCEAVWIFDREVCNLHPGNQSIVGEGTGRKKPISPMPWRERHVRDVSTRACGVCYFEQICRNCIPAGHYNHRGVSLVVKREKLPTPPQIHLFKT